MITFIAQHQFWTAVPAIGFCRPRFRCFLRLRPALAYQLWIMCHIHLGRLEKAFELTETDLSHGMPPVMLNIQKTHDVWLARLWAANRPPLQRPEITS